jgi:hypothetical protein
MEFFNKYHDDIIKMNSKYANPKDIYENLIENISIPGCEYGMILDDYAIKTLGLSVIYCIKNNKFSDMILIKKHINEYKMWYEQNKQESLKIPIMNEVLMPFTCDKDILDFLHKELFNLILTI